MANFNINPFNRAPIPGEQDHLARVQTLEGRGTANLDPAAISDNADIVEGYLGELNTDAPDPNLNSIALLESYRRSEAQAAGISDHHGEKQLKQLKERTAKEIALQSIITTDTVVNSDEHGVEIAPGFAPGGGPPIAAVKRHPTLGEIYDKKGPHYKSLGAYRDAIEKPRGNEPSRATIARRALDIFGALGRNADDASGVTERLMQIAGSTAYDKATLRLETNDDDPPLSALSGIINAGNPDLLTQLHSARDVYNQKQSVRTRKGWLGKKRKEADTELGTPDAAGTPAGEYNAKLQEVAAAIDASAGNVEEARALKTLVFNELAIRDAVAQRNNLLHDSRLARFGNRLERMGKAGNIALLGATAAAMTGLAIGTAGLGLAAPAAAAILGGARVGRAGFGTTLSSAKQYATLHLPGLHIAQETGDPAEDGKVAAQVVLHESDARVEAVDHAKKVAMLIGGVALAAGSAALIAHVVEGSSGAIHTEGWLGGHDNPANPSHPTPGASSSSPHPTPSASGTPHASPSATPSGETTPTVHPTPGETTPGTPGATQTPSTPGTGTHTPGTQTPGSPNTSHGPNTPNGANTPKVPNIDKAVTNLDTHGDNVVAPGGGIDATISNYANHTSALESTHYTPAQFNAMQAEIGEKLSHVKLPDGSPVTYEMSPGQYGFTQPGKLPDAASKIILQVMQEHAGHAAIPAPDVVTGTSIPEVVHGLNTGGYTEISTGEGWDAATSNVTNHVAALQGFQLSPSDISSIQFDAAKEIAAQHITFPNGAPVSYMIESGQYAGEYGIGDTGQLPDAATKILLQVAEQHVTAMANADGVNLNTLSTFIKANHITNVAELIRHLPAGATSYNRGEGLSTLLGAYNQVGFNFDTSHSLSDVAEQINKAKPGTLVLRSGRWVFAGRGSLSSPQITRIMTSLGYGQQDLALAAA